jgi:hypothetical protein
MTPISRLRIQWQFRQQAFHVGWRFFVYWQRETFAKILIAVDHGD